VVDADGVTVLIDYFSAWGIAEPAEIDLDLDNPDPVMGALATKIRDQIVRPMIRAAGGAPTTRIEILVGDALYDGLISHPEVRETYLNQIAAQELRNQAPFESFTYGGATWTNYRGSDDNSEIAINTDKGVAFPRGVPGMFQHVMGPGETFDLINRLGKRVYPLLVSDRDRNAWVQPEIYAYPLMLNTRPDLLLKVKRT